MTFPKIKGCVQIHSALSVRGRILTQVFLRIQDSFHYTTLAPFPTVTGNWNPKEKNEIWWKEKGTEKWPCSLTSASTLTLDLALRFSWTLSTCASVHAPHALNLLLETLFCSLSGPFPVCKTLGIQFYSLRWASLGVQMVKNLPAMQDTRVWSLGQEDPVVKEMATHVSLLAWKNHMDRGALEQATAHGDTRNQHEVVQCAGCCNTRGPRYSRRLEGKNVSDGIRSRVQCLLQIWLPGT